MLRIGLGLFLGALIWSLFFLIDYLVKPDPELERIILLYVFIGLGGLIAGLVPSGLESYRIVDGLISGSIYSVLFYITINLIQVFYLIKLGVLKELWDPNSLISSLLYIPIVIGCAIVGIAIRAVIDLLLIKIRKAKNK